MTWRKWRWRRIACGVLCSAFAYIGISAWQIASFPLESPATADAAIVLGAAVYDTTPSPVFRERINHAVALYRAEKVKRLIFTGATGIGDSLSEAEAGRRVAIDQGVPATAILLDTASVSTERNLLFANEVGMAAGIRTYFIVSDPLHMKRAILMAGDIGMKAYPSPTPTTMYRSVSAKASFLGREIYYLTRYRLRRPFADTIRAHWLEEHAG